MIAGIILAAGAARRMGQAKQLMPLAGKPMVWHVVSAACKSRLDTVSLVTGAAADNIAQAVAGLSVTILHNAKWENGQSGSLITGMQHLSPNTKAVMFLLADQPLITPELINSLIDAYHSSGQSILLPCYAGQRGNPVLFDYTKWKSVLSELSGDQGARSIIQNHPESIHCVPIQAESLLWDVDTEEDYRRVCKTLQQSQH
jgi:molybdenum cofactor cytidylyltransferase